VLEEQGLWEFVEGTPTPPTDPTQLAAHIRKDVKARRIIIDGVKDHIIPHLSGKKTTKEMWESLTKLYQSDNQSRKMMLREKLRSTKMARGDTVASYLTKFTQIRDELANSRGSHVDETELVRIALNGFTKQWDVFVQGVVAREKLPN
jgi:2-phosphoglycerate kinase